jgi:flagellar motor switch protein FliM
MSEELSQDEIDQLLTAIKAGVGDESESPFMTRDSRKIKIYDFKRPDMFTKNQIRNVQIVYEKFVNKLSVLFSKMHFTGYCHVASVDQLSYEEFIRSIPTPAFMALFEMRHGDAPCVLEIGSEFHYQILNILFGGTGFKEKFQRELHGIEQRAMEWFAKQMFVCMQEAWMGKFSTATEPALIGSETNPQFILPSVDPNEMTVLITMETKINDTEGMINICIPASVLKPLLAELPQTNDSNLKKIKENTFMQEKMNVNYKTANTMQEALNRMSVQIIAEIGRTSRNQEELLKFNEGTILELDTLSCEPVNIFANNVLIAKGEVVIIEDDNFGVRICEMLASIGNDEDSDNQNDNQNKEES